MRRGCEHWNRALADIREIFEAGNRALAAENAKSEKGDPLTVVHIATTDIIAKMVEHEDRPWAEFKRGQDITPVQLAKVLSKYHISPGNLWFPKDKFGDEGGHVAKGYKRKQFERAFAAYLPPYVEPETDTFSQAYSNSTVLPVSSLGPAENKGVEAISKPLGDGLPSGSKTTENRSIPAGPSELTGKNAENGGTRENIHDIGAKPNGHARRMSDIDRQIIDFINANPEKAIA